jgi:hypothetical protein
MPQEAGGAQQGAKGRYVRPLRHLWRPYCALWGSFMRRHTLRYCASALCATLTTVRPDRRVSVRQVPVPAYQSAAHSRQQTKERARVNADPNAVGNHRWGAAEAEAEAVAAADPHRVRDPGRGCDGKRASRGTCCNLARRAGRRRAEGTNQFRRAEDTNPFLPPPPSGTRRQPPRRPP